METIELTVDELLLAELDRVIRQLSMTRSDFARLALELALRNEKTICAGTTARSRLCP
jgi:metal-responsive CopG/Arc/MetJ family transcriptional regulator